MSTFVLVHGAWHGAWCWERLTPELESLGHRVITMDLPVDDDSATFEDYAEAVCDALPDDPEGAPVLVGHSLSGTTVPLVAARRPVQRIVYLCAMPPIPGMSFAQQMSHESEMLHPDYTKGLGEADPQGRYSWVHEDLARFHLFGDCDDVTVSGAFNRLRPQAVSPYALPCSLTELPAVASTYVVCTEDRIVNPDWSRRIAHEWLDAEIVELPGSHSPFFSQPKALAQLFGALV
jgi:pimeloyl-ACP methyl ester carboxylesterase